MSGDKRTVSTDALETLGTVIDETAGRDAIHLAVEPVVAGMTLRPGEDIGFLEDGTVGICNVPLGIVDPFLKDPVRKGERFWLVVYPRQITSLRHVWSHPSFADAEIKKKEKEKEKADSELWLRTFIASANCPDYDTVMKLATEGNVEGDYFGGHIDGEYMHFVARDAHGEIPSEFWHHVEVVSGKTLPWRPAFFSCSC